MEKGSAPTQVSFSVLLFANNAALKHVAAFCDPSIMCGDVGVYSAHYEISSSVHHEENMVGEP